MATGNSFTNYLETQLVAAILRNTTYTAGANVSVGLYGAALFSASTAYSVIGTYVVPTTGNQNTHIYKVTATGSPVAGPEPSWPTGVGSTVVANGSTFTEQTQAMEGGTFSELSGNGYARVNVGAANFGAAVANTGATTGSTSKNASVITFVAASANWNPAVGLVIADAAAAGNILLYQPFAAYLQISNGQQAQFNALGVTCTLD